MPHAWHATEYVNFAVEFNNHLNDLQPYQPSQTEAVATSYSLFDLTLLKYQTSSPRWIKLGLHCMANDMQRQVVFQV